MLILIMGKNPFTPEDFKELKKFGQVENFLNLNSYQTLKKFKKTNIVISSSAIDLNKNILKLAKNLKLIITASAAYDHIDLNFTKKKRITVCNSPTYHINTVTEYTIGLIIALSRKILQASESLKSGFWDPQSFQGTDLRSKILGIIGYGKVGSKVGVLAKPFGMKVLKIRSNSTKQDLLKLLKRSGIITIHAPLTSKTKNLIGFKEFKLMKPGVLMINTSRGDIINEEALISALRNGKVGGAALDVFEKEPLPKNHPFLNLPNLILTPHIASFTQEAVKRQSKEILLTLKSYLAGKPTNVIN